MDIEYGMIARVLLVGTVGWLGILLIQRVVTRALERWYNDPIRIHLIVRIVSYLCGFLVLTSLLQEFGINITALLGAAGILGVAFGFAAQASVSNIISGIFILIERPFYPDDTIQVDSFLGKVVDINLFSIGLITPDHRTIRIPHEKLLKTIIVNNTRRAKRRYEVTLSLAYQQDLEVAKQIFIDALKGESYCLPDQEPLVWVQEMNGDSVTLTIAVWVKSEAVLAARRHVLARLQRAAKESSIQLYQPSSWSVQLTNNKDS